MLIGATEVGLVAAGAAEEAFADKKLYVIEDNKGLWRRVAKSADEVPGSVFAHVGKSIFQFVRWTALDNALSGAGYGLPKVETKTPSDNGQLHKEPAESLAT